GLQPIAHDGLDVLRREIVTLGQQRSFLAPRPSELQRARLAPRTVAVDAVPIEDFLAVRLRACRRQRGAEECCECDRRARGRHHASLLPRSCFGQMPDLPGERTPFGSSASLILSCIFIRALSFQLYVPAIMSM